jgi:hypothetical protein
MGVFDQVLRPGVAGATDRWRSEVVGDLAVPVATVHAERRKRRVLQAIVGILVGIVVERNLGRILVGEVVRTDREGPGIQVVARGQIKQPAGGEGLILGGSRGVAQTRHRTVAGQVGMHREGLDHPVRGEYVLGVGR